METPVVSVFTRSGSAIAELDAQVVSCAWLNGRISQADIAIARSSSKYLDRIIRPLNTVMIQFNNGLPAWGGVISTDTSFAYDSGVIHLESAESILNYRISPKNMVLQNHTVGKIQSTLISIINGEFDTNLRSGAIYYGGETHDVEYHFDSVLQIMQDYLYGRLSSYAYRIRPELESGRLFFYLDVLERRGRRRPSVGLEEGYNAARARRDIQGTIINEVRTIGDGFDWGEDRLTGVARNDESANRFGLRQRRDFRVGTTRQTTLDLTAENIVSSSAFASESISVTALDLPPGRFSEYDIGDEIRVVLPSYGPDGANGFAVVDGRQWMGNGTTAVSLRGLNV